MSEYKVSRRIGRGGMAEVFLAMQEGIGGFEKLVVVKRIFPHFCEDDQFVKMFLDEARLAASIRHPNVVEILDIERDNDGFFIVMEYLDGETLAFILEQLLEADEAMPIGIVCRISADIAAGLHEAHAKTDIDGEITPIIHRDVTPSNLIVNYSGITKIVDFGVAKATHDKEHSRPGTLKGKLSYLAPEQVDNQAVDARTDVFQLGVVLHEMLTGRRLFREESDRETMNAILDKEIPRPSELRDGIPEVIDDIVMAALERDREKRLESADALRRKLEEALAELSAKTTQHDVREWMRARFSERYEARKKLERESTAEMRLGRPSSEMPAMAAPFAPTAPVVYGEGSGEGEGTKATVIERPTPPVPTARSRRRRGFPLLPVVGMVALAAAALVFWQMRGGSDGSKSEGKAVSIGTSADAAPTVVTPPTDAAAAKPDTFVASILVTPSNATIRVDGRVVGTGSYTVELPKDGKNHELRLSAEGYEPLTLHFTNAPPPRRIELQAVKTTAKTSGSRKGGSVTSTGRRKGLKSDRSSNGTGGTKSPPATKPDKPPKPDGPGTDNPDPWGK